MIGGSGGNRGLHWGVSGDPFEILGVPGHFELAAADLDRAYYGRATALHPDIASGHSEAPRKMAELNRAKEILSSPERRADALLRRLGGPDRTAHRQLPATFLAEIMQVREEIEAAMAAAPERREQERARWEAWAEGERARAIREVGAMFRGLGSPPDPESLRTLRTRLNAWRYIERLIEQLDPAYDPSRADFEDR